MIKRIALVLLACFVGLFIQATLSHFAAPWVFAPNVILVFIVALALRYRNVPGLFGAFTLGIISDFASGQFVGPEAAGAVVAFMLVGVIAERVYADRVVAIMFITFLCSIAKSMTYVSIVAFYLGDNLLLGHGTKVMLVEALLSALAAPLVLRFLLWGVSVERSTDFTASQRMTYFARGRKSASI